MDINTYLIFNGNCREAMSFYAKCLESNLHLMTYGDAPGCEGMPAEYKKWVIHARITKGKAVLMASDGKPGHAVKQGDNFMITLNCTSNAEVDQLFKALSEGGKVETAPQETFFAEKFGMFTDKFGINWMLLHEKKNLGK